MAGQPFCRSGTRAAPGKGVLVLACCLTLPGCPRTGHVAPEVPAPPWEGKPTLVLREDLGLVRHGQKVRQRFAITNDSQSKWTLARLHNGCACTACRPLTEEVWPGRSMAIDLDYTAAPRNVDDHRRVGVEFAEGDAPFVWLEVRACIRDPVSVFPTRLRIVPDGPGPPTASLEIHNCTAGDVHLLSVQAVTPWLTVNEPVPTAGSAPGRARQIWQVAVTAKADGLPAGRHQTEVKIKTDCPEDPFKVVPVELDLREPVQVAPRQLSFGTLAPNTPAQRKALFRYAAAAPSGRWGVALTHNLGEQLRVIYVELSPTLGELSAELTSTGNTADGEIKGLITVTFGGRDVPPVEIPVSAKVQRP
jgi:hypothetical protein